MKLFHIAVPKGLRFKFVSTCENVKADEKCLKETISPTIQVTR